MSAKQAQIGPYQVRQSLGRGGAGAVYLGVDPRSGQRVALKVLHAMSSGHQRRALLSEAVLGRRVQSPNCVQVLHVLEHGPARSPVLVSEFIEGLNAREFFERVLFPSLPDGRLSVLAACLILEQMLLGLRAAHEGQITHQDIKPENFLVMGEVFEQIEGLDRSPDPHKDLEDALLLRRDQAWIKLSDWGLALMRANDAELNASLSQSYTRLPEGKRGGTLVYMPPEQIEGDRISRRSDVFALGLIFYELLTGCGPEQGRSISENLSDGAFENVSVFLAQVCSSTAFSAVSVRRDPLLRSIPNKALLSLLERMCAREKDRRCPSRESMDELQAVIEDEIEGVGRTPASWTGYAALFLLSLVLTGAVSWFAFQFQSGSLGSSEVSSESDIAAMIEAGDAKVLALLPEPTPEQCRRLARWPGPDLSLPKVSTLSLEQARLLAEFQGPSLRFPGLESLDAAVAQELGQFRGQYLGLSGLKDLELGAARALFQGRKQHASKADWPSAGLPALRSIARLEGVSEGFLAQVGDGLSATLGLQGLTRLKPEVAAELSALSDHSLLLTGLGSDWDESTWQELTKTQFRWLQFGPGMNRRLSDTRIVESLRTATLMVIYEDGESGTWATGLSAFRRQLVVQGPELSVATLTDLVRGFGFSSLVLPGLKELSLLKSKALSRLQRGIIWLDGVQSLSPEVAESFSDYHALGLGLNGLVDLDLSLAQRLRHFRGNQLGLSGLKELRPMPAKMLAEYPGTGLWFVGLESFKNDAAEELGRFQGGTLVFDKLKTLSPKQARALVAHPRKRLILAGSFPATAELARSLQGYQGEVLEFASAEPMPDDCAREFAKIQSQGLSFPKTRQCSPVFLAGLAQFEGTLLSFPKMSMNEQQLGALKNFEGDLDLRGQISLTESQAQVLAGLKAKDIELSLTEALTPAVAKQLAAHSRGVLTFLSLREMNAATAQEIAAFKSMGLKCPGLFELSVDSARALKSFPKTMLRIQNLDTVDASLAAELAQWRNPTFVLRRVRKLSVEVAKIVGGRKRTLIWLPRLDALNDALAVEMQNWPCDQLNLGLRHVTVNQARCLSKVKARQLELESLRSLTPDQARALAQFGGKTLVLSGLEQLDFEGVQALSEFRGERLVLRGLRSLDARGAALLAGMKLKSLSVLGDPKLSADIARSLAAFQGQTLILRCTELNLAAARELAQCKAQNLIFSNLARISPKVLGALSQFRGKSLSLPSLNSMSVDQAFALSKFQGTSLQLDGLRALSPKAARQLALCDVRYLLFGGMKQLQPRTLQALAGFSKQGVVFGRAWRIDAAAAKELVSFRCQFLQLTGLTHCSEESLNVLKKYPGQIYSTVKFQAHFEKK